MSISPKCNKCGKEFDDFGGLAFSPPMIDQSTKFHLCSICWKLFEEWINQKGNKWEICDKDKGFIEVEK